LALTWGCTSVTAAYLLSFKGVELLTSWRYAELRGVKGERARARGW